MSYFITFEGGEGSGKSTQSGLLHRALLLADIESILTREPGGTPAAEEIRNLLLHGKIAFRSVSELLLHNVSRYEHLHDKIIPALKKSKIVICDRFIDSTVAYQGYARKIGEEAPLLLHKIFMDNLMPDITFILDIDPQEGLRRADGQINNYEKLGLEFHESVRTAFHKIAANNVNRCVIIDSNDHIENIHKKIVDHINDILPLHLNYISENLK
jgi:dTMP kinase